MEIIIEEYTGTFAENKYTAKKLREGLIKPIVYLKEKVTLNFNNIDSTTQSFIHALISEICQKDGEEALEYLEFKSCNKAVKSIVKTVINYSLD